MGRRACGFGAALLSVVACAHRGPSVPPVPPEGRTSFRALAVPGAPGAVEILSDSITPAYPSADNRTPEYPAYALKAGCRSGIVPVRVYVDASGNVSSQRDVPDRPLPSDGCHMAFRAAVQGAVDDWKFAPSYRMTPERGPEADGQPGITRWNQTPIAIYLDFEFSFEVVGGKGVVRPR